MVETLRHEVGTLTLRATRADAEGPSERSVQIPGAEHCSRSLLFAIRTIVEELVGHSWSLSVQLLQRSPNGLPTPDVCALVGAIAEAVDYRL